MAVRCLVLVLMAVLPLIGSGCEDLQPEELEFPDESLSFVTSNVPGGQVGVAYSTVVAASGGIAPFAWGISAGSLPPGLGLGTGASNTETISGTPTTSGQYDFDLTVVAADAASATVSLTIIVQPAAPGALIIQTTTLGDASLNQAYSNDVVATGGTSPYQWSIVSGTLPPGLNLVGNTGLVETISGTPTMTGTFNFTIRVTDSLLQTAQSALTLTVNTTGALTIQTSSLPSGALGAFYQAGIAASGGSQSLYVWGVLGGALPPGLSISATGTPATSIAGTPTSSGTFVFSVFVTDSLGGFAARSFQIDIAGPGAATQLEISVPSTTTAGVPFSATVTAKDALGNVATGYTGTVGLQSSDPNPLLPAAHSFTAGDAGVFMFTGIELRTTGSWNISAGDGTLLVTSSQISVSANTATQMVVSGLLPFSPLGAPQTFTVTLHDAFSNVATGYTGTVTFSSSDGAATLPTDYTFVLSDAGVHQFSNGVTFQTGGTQTLTAQDTMTGSITDSATVDVVSDVVPDVTTTLSAGRVSLIPGEVLEFDITVEDQLGDDVELQLLNPMPGMSFTPVLLQSGPVTRRVYWEVKQGMGGYRRLLFVARDDAVPANTTHLAIEMEILGDSGNSSLNIDDVTGDGVPDLVCSARNADAVATDSGAVYVWVGSSTPTGNPDFTLSVPGSAAGDRLGNIGTFGDGRQAIQLADLTGDGVLDILVGASEADVSSVQNTGAIHVWVGGATISSAPSFSLVVPGAGVDDRLGEPEFGQGILLRDVTGDAQIDVVALATFADIGGTTDTGAIYVWEGGATISSMPDFTLSVPGAAMNTRLGYTGGAQGIWCYDVTRDGIDDIISGTQRAVVSGANEAGAVYVWKGGATIPAAPSFTLTLPSPQGLDRLGEGAGRTIQFADVSGDNVPDVLVSCKNRASGSSGFVGGVFVWRGGATLAANPNWSLQPTVVSGSEQIGFRQHARIADVTGDGVPDVVASAPNATVGTQTSAGKLYVWRGGATLGNVPNWTLQASSPVTGDELGTNIRLIDLTGDGTADIFAGAPRATVGVASLAGAAHVWRGGTNLTTLPTFSLAVSGAASGDNLGADSRHFVDFTGDGVRDILLVSRVADGGGVVDSGAMYLWHGGAAISSGPNVALLATGAQAGDEMGWEVALGDLTGDGIPEIVARDESTRGGFTNAGALQVWQGGATISSSPSWTLTEAAPSTSAYLGQASYFGLLLADMTGDGVLDLIAGTRRAGPSSRGAAHVWVGGAILSATPDFTLQDSTASSNSQMGFGSGQCFQLTDWNGDGVVDVLGVASREDGAVADTGSINFWTGPISSSGDPAVKLEVPGASAGDRLGG